MVTSPPPPPPEISPFSIRIRFLTAPRDSGGGGVTLPTKKKFNCNGTLVFSGFGTYKRTYPEKQKPKTFCKGTKFVTGQNGTGVEEYWSTDRKEVYAHVTLVSQG